MSSAGAFFCGVIDVAEGKELNARERLFVEYLADPTDRRTIPDKARAAGYTNGVYGYEVSKREHIAAAVREALGETIRALQARRLGVLNALADRAEQLEIRAKVGESGETVVVRVSAADANQAAQIFLQHTGGGGNGDDIPENDGSGDTFEARVLRAQRRRLGGPGEPITEN